MANSNLDRRSGEPIRLAASMAAAGWPPRRLPARGARGREVSYVRLVEPRGASSACAESRRRPTQQVARDFVVAIAIATLWLALMEALQTLLG